MKSDNAESETLHRILERRVRDCERKCEDARREVDFYEGLRNAVQELVEKSVAAEREECAKIAAVVARNDIAEKIRARGLASSCKGCDDFNAHRSDVRCPDHFVCGMPRNPSGSCPCGCTGR